MLAGKSDTVEDMSQWVKVRHMLCPPVICKAFVPVLWKYFVNYSDFYTGEKYLSVSVVAVNLHGCSCRAGTQIFRALFLLSVKTRKSLPLCMPDLTVSLLTPQKLCKQPPLGKQTLLTLHSSWVALCFSKGPVTILNDKKGDTRCVALLTFPGLCGRGASYDAHLKSWNTC